MYNIDKRYTDIGVILLKLLNDNIDVCRTLLKIIKTDENKIELFSNVMDQITFLKKEHYYLTNEMPCPYISWPFPSTSLYKYILLKNFNKKKDYWLLKDSLLW